MNHPSHVHWFVSAFLLLFYSSTVKGQKSNANLLPPAKEKQHKKRPHDNA
jgi:hypothetical protein